MTECIFCKIVKGDIPSQIVKKTKKVIVFEDINPRAPVHLLIVPKKHILDISKVDDATWVEIKKVANQLAKDKKLKGYRLTHNAGEASLVRHMHVHFLGGVLATREV